jgi:O-antigen/teichoic acid export membrane protein
MNNKRLNKLKLNSALGIIYQVTAVIINLILPRFFLKYYGSNVNGLISSITQFLSFINLADMGIGAVVSSALYKPLAEGDDEKVSQIVAFARKFFKIVGFILIGYVVVLTFVYPVIVENSFSVLFTLTLLWAMCISQFGQYFIGITYQLLLNADQRSYVQLFINTVTTILNAIAAIFIMIHGGSVQFVKLTTSVIYLARPIFMYAYVRRHYNIDYKAKPNANAVPQKKSGIIQHIAYMVYQNTDVAVLTLFSTLANVSIYSVYVLVNNGIKAFVTALTTGFQAMFGNMIANKEQEQLTRSYDMYDWMLHTVCSYVYTLTSVLIVPFILTYTRGINDANYNVPIFAVVITIAYACNTVREGMFVVIKAAGHYKQTQKASLTEAILNLSLSILFVFKFGLVGVAIGTMIATSFFGIYEMHYLSKHILYRKPVKYIRQLLVDLLSVLVIVACTHWIHITTYTYLVWFGKAMIAAAIGAVILLAIEWIFYRDNLKTMFKIMHKRIAKA